MDQNQQPSAAAGADVPPPEEDPGPQTDILFAPMLAALQAPARKGRLGAAGWMVLTFLAFVVLQRGTLSPRPLLLLVMVLCFHELGHYLGMLAFGYRDVKIFFVPFAGALMTGKPGRAAGWKQALVLLLGPLPGILLALGLALTAWQRPYVLELAFWLIGLNAFNLLPLSALDGGQLLNLIIFSRHRVLETLFMGLGSVGLFALGLALQAWFLLVLGGLGVLTLAYRYRTVRAAQALRRRWPDLPDDLAAAEPALLAELFVHARQLTKATSLPRPEILATIMRSIHQQALVRPVSALASVGLFLLYLVGVVVALVTLVLLFDPNARLQRAMQFTLDHHPAEALSELNGALQAEAPREVRGPGLSLRAALLREKGEHRKAIADLEALLQLEPANARARADLASILLVGPEELRDAKRALTLVADEEEDDDEAEDVPDRRRRIRALAYYRLGRFGEAAQLLGPVAQGEGGSAPDHLILAMSYKRLGETAKARASYARAGAPAGAPAEQAEVAALRTEAAALLEAP